MFLVKATSNMDSSINVFMLLKRLAVDWPKIAQNITSGETQSAADIGLMLMILSHVNDVNQCR